MQQQPLSYEFITYPEGFRYAPDFISEAEEQHLLTLFKDMPFKPYVYEGYDAKREIISYTKVRGYPTFLLPYIKRVSAFIDVPREHIMHAMVTQYRPGTQLGWHRDMPPYDKIIGISLGSSVPFRFRRKVGITWERITVTAEPRSIYMMSGPSRYEWQHSIPPVDDWRYSITMRTSTYV
jgi:alkylated DNA repair dioxygenase AlkB